MRNVLIFTMMLLFANTATSAEPSDSPRGRLYTGFELNGADWRPIQTDTDPIQESYATLGLGVRIGYDWSNRILTEFNVNSSTTFDLLGAFDTKRVTETQLLMGLEFPVSNNVKLIPWVGWSDWKTTDREGQLFNPGPELTEESSGSGLIARAEIALSAGDNFAFSLYHSYADYDIATMQTVSAGMRVYF